MSVGTGTGQLHERPAPAERLVAALRSGLEAPLPTIPCAFLYDDRGSRLFEQITRLPEYYQTRTEEALLERVAGSVARAVSPAELVELGSGAGRKIRRLIQTCAASGPMRRCTLLDINPRCLAESVASLRADFPEVAFRGLHADFQSELALLGPGGGRLVLLLAGTIGNLEPAALPAFLRSVAAQLEAGDGFLVGLDLVKDPTQLEAAYNDSAGVTADFNLNVLAVLNHQVGADFDLAAWEHVAFYDVERQWIEMRVRSRCAQRVELPQLDLRLHFDAGDEIRTEISAKFTRGSLLARLEGTGLFLDQWHVDDQRRFALALLRRAGDGAPCR
jgi:L-histidine Nalpha-methyltransferase